MVLRLKLQIVNERLVTSIKDYKIRQLQSDFPTGKFRTLVLGESSRFTDCLMKCVSGWEGVYVNIVGATYFATPVGLGPKAVKKLYLYESMEPPISSHLTASTLKVNLKVYDLPLLLELRKKEPKKECKRTKTRFFVPSFSLV